MNKNYVIIGLSAFLCLSKPVMSNEYTAQQISSDTAQKLTMQGDVAWSGIDDWHLSNGRICAVISDPSHESELSPSGGYLTDLGFCGVNSESFVNLYFALNLTSSMYPAIKEISRRVDKNGASLITRGEFPGLEFKATYRLDDTNQDRLQIVTELTRTTETDININALNIVKLSIGNSVFSGSLKGTGPAPGFTHQALPSGLFGDMDGLLATDTIISLPDAEDGKQMAYGLHIKDSYLRNSTGERQPIQTFIGVVRNYAAVIAFTQPFWFDNNGKSLDLLKLIQSQLSDLSVGTTLVLEQEVTVAQGRSISGILDAYWHDQPTIEGRLHEANLPIFLRRPDGGLVNQTMTNETGSFSFKAPRGSYDLIVTAPGREPLTRSVILDGDNLVIDDIELKGAATVQLPKGHVMRLSFVPLDGQLVDFTRQPFGFRTGDREPAIVRDVMLIGNQHDTDEVKVKPGRYRIISSRGPEYSAHAVELHLMGNQTYDLEIPIPHHTNPTPGYVNADLHTHSAPSFDNSYPQSQRVKSYLAQGGEVLVATEHENIYDLGNDIAALGLSDQLASVIGTEITGEAVTPDMPYSIGHSNAFPIRIKPYEYRNGHPPHEGRRWRDIIADLKAQNPKTLVQLNHARTSLKDTDNIKSNSAYFSHLIDGNGYDPSRPLDQTPNTSLIEKDEETGLRDIDFDAMELLNGTWSDLYSYKTLREDWFSLLRQGIRIAGTATSDSHGQTFGEIVLEPRTLIAMKDDSISGFNEELFLQAIKSGNLYGTNGPLLDIHLIAEDEIRTMGETLSGNQANLVVTASGANWVDVNLLRIYVNGNIYTELEIETGKEVSVPITFGKDSFVTIEVEGPRQGLFADLVNVQIPFAFSNPIYVDADTDGRWEAPGL